MIDKNQYLKDRIDDQISWYGAKSRQNKLWYRRLRVLSIVVSLSIPILTNYIDDAPGGHNTRFKLAIAIAGGLVALIEGLLSLNKYHDLWVTYRGTSEGLKYHRYLFEVGAAPYNVANAFQLFVQNAEGMMATEHSNWIKVAAEEPKPKDEEEEPPTSTPEA